MFPPYSQWAWFVFLDKKNEKSGLVSLNPLYVLVSGECEMLISRLKPGLGFLVGQN